MDNLLSLITNGFCVLEQVIEPNYVSKLKEVALKLQNTEVAANDSKTAFYDTSSKIFNDTSMLHDTVECVLKRYFGGKFLLNRSWLRSSYAGYKGSNWHQDASVNIIPCPIIVAIPLSDTNNTNGALRVVPRTQTLPHPCFNDKRYDAEVILNSTVGDVILFQSALWHRGGSNETNRNRDMVFTEFKSCESLTAEFDHMIYQSFQVPLNN
ncbi:phytanoyl-CoA dioxygenase family protein [Colwellia sp. Bg11-28]|uniref:phytanoyl-CoA dioxygenase family protein n=1 Tax=Colwellia sp. Bg11-28 TaxID=2058305 RepID=UPI0012FF5415|nr:phytanoyl-CoA dioxygenase family protein [Colwellia sp. Bg11-28]